MSTPAARDELIRRYGDDVYRLAVLLLPDELAAARAVRQLFGSAAALAGERGLLAALLAALPKERGRHRPPPWAQRGRDAPALAAIAALPREARLALAPAALRTFSADALRSIIAPAPSAAPPAASTAVAGAPPLLALARALLPAADAALLDVAAAPDDCRPARAAIVAGAVASADPAVRGHLALCAACRAASAVQRDLAARADDALRDAFRDVTLPPALAEQLAADATPRSAAQRVWRSPWLGRALLPLLVIGAILALVIPQTRRSETGARPAALSAAPADAATLLERARATLYAAPDGKGVWSGRYAIFFPFPDGSSATLAAQLWRDTEASRHRLQLVHANGGAPFEFELGDGRTTLRYAATPAYGAALYPQLGQYASGAVQLAQQQAEQRAMLEARLASGAWALGGQYLELASAAGGMRSFGSRVADDGTALQIVGFRALSPLARADDAAPATILLALASDSGRLYEVREISSPDGGEQTGRVTWQYLGGEWLDAAQKASAFDIDRAYNGVAPFEPRDSIASPLLPLVPQTASIALEHASYTGLRFPAIAPPGAAAAALVQMMMVNTEYAVTYIGPQRRLAITAMANATISPANAETVKIGAATALIRAGPSRRYDVRLLPDPQLNTPSFVLNLTAVGYGRAELVALLGSLRPLDSAIYRDQSRLFVASSDRPSAVVEALLDLIAAAPDVPSVGHLRHLSYRVFSRQQPRAAAPANPYQMVAYGGQAETTVQQTWLRPHAEDTNWAMTDIQTLDGGTIDRYVFNGGSVMRVDGTTAVAAQVSPDAAPQHAPGTMLAWRMLGCGAYVAGQPTLATDGGARTLTYREANVSASCLWFELQTALEQQQSEPHRVQTDALRPYLFDLAGKPLFTSVTLDADGRPSLVAICAGEPVCTPLQSWQTLTDEELPAASVGAFDQGARPDAVGSPLRLIISLDNQLASAAAPVYLLDAPGVTLGTIERVETPTGGSSTDEDVLSAALDTGVATLQTYSMPQGQTMRVYQGSEAAFGGFLHQHAVWSVSVPEAFAMADGGSVAGWRVMQGSGPVWALLPLGETLVAAEMTYAEQTAALATLRLAK